MIDISRYNKKFLEKLYKKYKKFPQDHPIWNAFHDQSVDLKNLLIGDEGTQVIFMALDQNIYLKSINLANNNITDIGAKIIAKTIRFDMVLEDIDLQSNNIGPIGAQAIISALSVNTHLINISLQKNPILKKTMITIENSIKFNKMLNE